MNDDEGLIDRAFDDTGPFRVSPESGGVSLETALRDFGPAAIDDLIPRIRAIAHRLDAAHRAGIVHGALHPSKVFVNDAATSVIAGTAARVPYTAPEVIDGRAATPLSDQYSLAAIAYEWLFGRPVSHNGDRPIEVRAMPGVDRLALSRAFTRALAQKPGDRFASCGAFCDALAGAVVPELPLLASTDTEAAALVAAAAEADAADVDDFAPEDPSAEPPIVAADLAESPVLNVDDIKIVAEESILTAAQPDLDAIAPPFDPPPPPSRPLPPPDVAVPSWDPPALSATPRPLESPRFGAFALFFVLIVGAVFGFAAGYMARPRALQSQPPQTMANQGASAASTAPDASGAAPKAPVAPAPKAPEAPAPKATANPGRLLVRSFPSGASVTVDGVARGDTPLALRDLDTGTRNVVVERRGYVAQTLKVSITKARPARTLDVRLAPSPEPASPKPVEGGAPRPGTPSTLGKPAVSTGSLTVDSRPPGAAVTINGKPSGTTPLTITDLAPGEYQIVMTMPGYRNVTTTVRVVAGERARAAASLTALEQQ